MEKNQLLLGLESLGFRTKEARLYLSLLQLGEATAYQVAKHSGLKRATAYLLLEQLRERGMVVSIPGAARKTFVAKDPQEIVREAEQSLARGAALVPTLQRLQRADRHKIQVLYYQGYEGVCEAMRYGMEGMQGKEMVAFWAEVSDETDKRFGYFKEWHDLFRLFKISLRAFIPEGEIHHKYRAYDAYYRRKMKILPRREYCPYTFFDMGDTFTRFFDPTHMQAIVIENPSVTDALRQVFELVWRDKGEVSGSP